MTKENKHTPIPWDILKGTTGRVVSISANEVVAECFPSEVGTHIQGINAKFIVTAVNAYEKNRELIRELVDKYNKFPKHDHDDYGEETNCPECEFKKIVAKAKGF